MGATALKLPPQQRERMRAIVDALATFGEGERPVLDALLPELCALFESPRGLAHGYVERGEGLGIDFFYARGMRPGVAEWYDDWLSRRPQSVLGYNPIRPDPSQRNRALLEADLARLNPHYFDTPVRGEVYPSLGLGDCDQLRVLVCEGGSLLSWVGVWRHERYAARHKAMLRALVRPLRRRLFLERAMGTHVLLESALACALEALVQPALVVRAGPRVLGTNAAARQILDRRRRDTLEELSRALAGKPSRFVLSKLRSPGCGATFLAIARHDPSGEAAFRAAAAAARWALTPRQEDVLRLVVEGRSNLAIAACLQIAEGTVEIHVSAILAKARVTSRSALAARVMVGA